METTDDRPVAYCRKCKQDTILLPTGYCAWCDTRVKRPRRTQAEKLHRERVDPAA